MTFVTERRVEFRDTDTAGIIHFTTFFGMMESAEHELFRSLGLSVHPAATDRDPSPLRWPRVASACEFLAPVRFEDVLRIEVSLARLGMTSARYRFRFSHSGQPIADGTITVVCCRFAAGKLSKTQIPADVRSLLEQHLAGEPAG